MVDDKYDKGSDSSRYLEGFSDIERKALLSIFQEAKEQVISKQWKQVRDILPAKEWIKSTYYAGGDVKKFFPFWVRHFLDVFENHLEPKYNEIIVEGGIRTGKSTFANYCVMYLLYMMSCYENVQSRYDLMSFTLITIAYLTVNMRTAEIAGFGAFRDMLDTVPYFREHFRRADGLNSVLKFPQNILMLPGSTENHFIGTAMLYFIMDEANFFMGGVPSSDDMREHSRVASLYESALNRATLQYTLSGINMSMAFLISSPTYSSSFVEKRKQMAMGNKRTKLVRATLWKVRPENYGSERFVVFIGSSTLEPCVVDSVSKINDYLLSVGKGSLPSDVVDVDKALGMLDPYSRLQFELVPIEFRERFNTTAFYKAVQDIIGVCVQPAGKLFSSNTAYRDACDDDIERAFIEESFVLSTDSDISIEDYFNPEYVVPDKDKPRFIHVDQSLVTDKTGISCCYERGKVMVGGVEVSDVVVEFKLEIHPPDRPAQIDISKSWQFIMWYKRVKGVTIGKVTADTFASAEGLQTLNKAGIDAEVLSLDRSDEQYLAFTELYYQRRIHHRSDDRVRVQLFGLIHNRAKRKVTHEDNISGKDIVDGMCGSVYNCLRYYNNPKELNYRVSDHKVDNGKGLHSVDGVLGAVDVDIPEGVIEEYLGVWSMLSEQERKYVKGEGSSGVKGSRYNY